MGQWRDGQRAMDGNSSEGFAGQSQPPRRRPFRALQRTGQRNAAQYTRFSEIAGARPRDERRSDDRLRHESSAAADAQWISAARGGSRMVRDLLGQVAERYRG